MQNLYFLFVEVPAGAIVGVGMVILYVAGFLMAIMSAAGAATGIYKLIVPFRPSEMRHASAIRKFAGATAAVGVFCYVMWIIYTASVLFQGKRTTSVDEVCWRASRLFAHSDEITESDEWREEIFRLHKDCERLPRTKGLPRPAGGLWQLSPPSAARELRGCRPCG